MAILHREEPDVLREQVTLERRGSGRGVGHTQAAAFTVEGQRIALFNVEGTYYAIGDTCTHRGGPLSEGDVQGTKVTCQWYGADFDLKTGAVEGPPAQKGVPSYKVVVEGDDIKVEV